MKIDADRIDDVVKRVEERTARFEKDMEKSIGPYGLRRLPDEKFVPWFIMNAMQKYPPQPLIGPDGRMVVISPWVAMLPYVKGGDDVLKRFEKLMGRRGR